MKIKLHTCLGETKYSGWEQYISFWEKMNFIERIQIPFPGRCVSWLGGIGNLCIEPSHPHPIEVPFEHCLCNQYRTPLYKDNPNIYPLEMFVRDWNSYEKVLLKPQPKRIIKSLFSGTIRGDQHTRNKWKGSTEVWNTSPARTWTRVNRLYPTMEDYYDALRSTVFGLSLGGDGGTKSVCCRDVEILGMGCVPIYDEHVEVKGLKNYILAKDPDDMNNKINSMTQEQIADISESALDYFWDYSSPIGMWYSIIEKAEELGVKL